MASRDRRNFHRGSRPAFTLVELILAIALGLILMLGISAVFRMTSESVGASQAMSAGIRDTRAAQAVLYRDLTNAAFDGPFMIITSRTQPGFRNAADAAGDRDFDPSAAEATRWTQILTTDLNGNNTEGEAGVPGEVIAPAIYNQRNHRIDTFSFFVRDLVRRQTGNDGVLMANQSASEALIWYGHLWLPNGNFAWPDPAGNDSTFPGKGSPSSNPNNYYSTQWILGRVATLLRDPTGTSNVITDQNGTPQFYLQRQPVSTAAPPASNYELSPLQVGTPAPGSTPLARLEHSRFDLAGTSISTFTAQMQAYPVANWWTKLMVGNTLTTPITTGGRYQASPVLVKPISSASYARQSPIFLPGCTQFIVEYAGDFVTQDTNPASAAYGHVTDVYTTTGATDGVTDFVVQGTGVNAVRKIRWYGLPRDTNGDGIIRGTGANANLLPDVVPLRDVVATLSPGFSGAPFEKFTWTGTPAPSPNPTLPNRAEYHSTTNGMESDEYYTCAWGPSDRKPTMIRITLVVDDPGGRLAEGQTFEYVFTLP